MTLPEFRAWFDGFTEGMDGPPDAKQWKRIKARVGEITGAPITYPIYLDRYVYPYRPYWATSGHFSSETGQAVSAIGAGSLSIQPRNAIGTGGALDIDMRAAGRAEAASLRAA